MDKSKLVGLDIGDTLAKVTYKIGDRIRISSKCRSPYYTPGERGTVIVVELDNKKIGVEFDKPGRNRHTCERTGTLGRCRWVTYVLHHIEIIDRDSLDWILRI